MEGRAWYQRRSSLEGARSFSHASIRAFSLVTPLGHKRSTSTRAPSAMEGLSYARFSPTSMGCYSTSVTRQKAQGTRLARSLTFANHQPRLLITEYLLLITNFPCALL